MQNEKEGEEENEKQTGNPMQINVYSNVLEYGAGDLMRPTLYNFVRSVAFSVVY